MSNIVTNTFQKLLMAAFEGPSNLIDVVSSENILLSFVDGV